MRKRALAIGVVVVLLAVALVWRFARHGGGEAARDTAGSAAAGGANGATKTGRDGKLRAPAVPASVAGKVTRKADGAGVEGAIVTLGRAEMDAIFGDSDQSMLTATTDALGEWHIDKVAPGRYTASATARGMIPATLDKLNVGDGEHKTGVDLVLDAGGTRVSGLISDIGGGPVVGARIALTKDTGMPWAVAPLVTMSGNDGRYELWVAPGGYNASVSQDDYAGAVREIEVATVPVVADFTLSPGGVIRGVVVTRDNKPLPDAAVHAAGSRHRGGGGEARANEKGEFVLHGLGSGVMSLTASGRGFASDQPTVVELGIGEQVDGVKIVVDKAYSISGNVVDKVTGKGIAGVRLGAFSIAKEQFAVAPDPSDADGAFIIVGVKPASYMLFAISEEVMPEIGKPVEVVDKDVTGIVVEMGVGVTVTGRVDPGVVAQITVEPKVVGLANMFEALKAILVRAESTPTGEFTLKHVPPGAFTLRAEVTADGRTGTTPLLVANQDVSNVVVTLEPRASLAGKVVDASGAPAGHVRVTIKEKAAGDEKFQFRMNDKSRDETTTAADGTFRMVGLEAGVHTLQAADEQGTLGWADSAHKAKPREPIEVTLAKAEQKTGVTLTVEARDGTIKGTVTDKEGKPVADVFVSARLEAKKTDERTIEYGEMMAEMGGKPPTLTGADGAFAFDHLRAGTYTLSAETAKGTARVEKPAVAIGATVTLVLAPLGTVSGRVTLNGAPVTAFDVSCDGPGPDVTKHVESADGTYTLERIPPGKVTCTADADAGRGTAPVDVPAGPVTLDIPLAPFATITGTVVSVLTNEPIAGLKAISEGMGNTEKSIDEMLHGKGPTSDAQGHFRIPSIAAGKGSVSIVPADQFVELAHRDYSVTAGQHLDLGVIKVVPPRQGDAGTLGLATTLDGDALVISALKPGGPAEGGGVQVGDKLVAINGIPVATLTPALAQTLISSGTVTVGQRYALTLDRGGAPVEVVLVGVRW